MVTVNFWSLVSLKGQAWCRPSLIFQNTIFSTSAEPTGNQDQRPAQIALLLAGQGLRKLPTVHTPIIQVKHETQAVGVTRSRQGHPRLGLSQGH